MDPSAFDRLSRALAATPTRRSALAGLAGAVTALVSRIVPADAPDATAQSRICRPIGGLCFPDRGLTCCRGATCQNGRCRCPKRSHRCGGRCLRKRKCCRHRDCPGNQVCGKGRCRCAAGKERCQGRCIARTACCGGCTADQRCANGTCVAERCGTGAPCRVFITQGQYPGDLRENSQGSGIAGADAKCQAHANASPRTRGGTYKAWISGSTLQSSPSHRFTNLDRTGPYVLVDDDATLVANDWTDLTTSKEDAYLRVAVCRTEFGVLVEAAAWTHTLPDGSPGGDPDDKHCQDWTIGDNSDAGNAGHSAYSNVLWTSDGPVACDESITLYCFEQG